MPRKYSDIKWRNRDEEELTKAIRKFNNKITRLAKQNDDIVPFLPTKINKKELKNSIKTRNDFKKEINSLKRYLVKGAEQPITTKKGVYTNKWEIGEIKNMQRSENIRRSIERKKADVSTYKGTMGSIKANNLEPKKIDIDSIPISQWKNDFKHLKNRTNQSALMLRIEKYKQDYIKNVEEKLAGGDIKKQQELINLLKSISATTIYYAYYDDPVLQINFTSDPIPAQQILDKSLEHWRETLGQNKEESEI